MDGRDIKVNGPARRSSLRPARCSGAAATGPRPWTTSPTPRGSAGPCCCITSRPRSAVLGDLLAGYTTAITAVANRLLDATPHDRAAAATEAGRCRGRPARPPPRSAAGSPSTKAPARWPRRPTLRRPGQPAAPAAGRNHRWSRRRAARHRGRRCGHQALRPPTPRAAIRPTRPACCSSRTRNELPLGAVRAAICGRVGTAPLRGKSATRC